MQYACNAGYVQFFLPHLSYTAAISATWHPKFIGDVVMGGVNIYCPLPYCVTQEIFHTGQCSPLSMKTDSFERYRWGRQRTLLSLKKKLDKKDKIFVSRQRTHRCLKMYLIVIT
jgi:hypothetical protein